MTIETVTLERIVGGGQTLGVLPDGKKIFVWGGLPGETVEVRLTKQKSSYAEGVVEQVVTPAAERVKPRDPESCLSTSPWQIMDFAAEQQAKGRLIEEAFRLHHVVLPASAVFSDGQQYGYRNKVEFSWWWEHSTAADSQTITAAGQLELAFYKRGSHGKQPVEGTALARPEINQLALAIRDLLRTKQIGARSLKTLLIRCNRQGGCVWQLYLKDKLSELLSADEAAQLPAFGGELIYSDPRSPASRITERLAAFGAVSLTDKILGVPFQYATEGFFQVNVPVYEQALRDMQRFVGNNATLDLYSGVGSIGLTIGHKPVTLVEVDAHAFRELEYNVRLQQPTAARPVLAAAEKALDYITSDATVIVDPPRVGLHQSVIDRLLEVRPPRIIYLSCNPVTQARDSALLAPSYKVGFTRGYNFFPRTPHIEHLVILERAAA